MGTALEQAQVIFDAFAKGIILGDKRVGLRARDYVRREAPVVTTNLKNSVEIPAMKSGTGGIAKRTLEMPITASYASHVIYGTRPHEIRAGPGKAIPIKTGGGIIFRKAVQHPGTKANNFPQRGIDKMVKSGEVNKIYDKAINEQMGKI